MAEESDGMADAFDGQIRIALTVATQMAARFARLREELARTAQARTEQQTRELQARFDAERSAARASLALVQQSEWWNTAGVDDIATAYETAEAWRPVDEDIARTSDHMREELRTRYGIDVANLAADPAAVRDAIERTERNRADAAAMRRESVEDMAEGATLLAAADQLDKAAEERDRARDENRDENTVESEAAEGLSRDEVLAETDMTRNDSLIAYDSAARRAAFAADLDKAGVDPELARVRIVTDRENATHPSEAVATKPGKQRKARTKTHTPGMQRERGGLSR